jgi:hypothetical protein
MAPFTNSPGQLPAQKLRCAPPPIRAQAALDKGAAFHFTLKGLAAARPSKEGGAGAAEAH